MIKIYLFFYEKFEHGKIESNRFLKYLMTNLGVLAVGTYDGILYCYRIWKIPEGCTEIPEGVPENYSGYFASLLFNFESHDQAIRQVAASSTRYLAAGGSDGSISIFDLKTMKNIGSLMQHEDAIEGLEFYQDDYLISASLDKTIGLWRVSDWNQMKQLKGHTASISAISISPTGKFMLSAGRDGSLRMWDLMHGHNARTRKLDVFVSFIGFSEDSTKFFYGFDTTVILVDGVTENLLFDFQHEKQVTCYGLGNNVLWVGTTNGHLYAWSMETGEKKSEYIISKDRIKMVKVHQNYLFSLTSAGQINICTISEDYELDTILQWDIKRRITSGAYMAPV